MTMLHSVSGTSIRWTKFLTVAGAAAGMMAASGAAQAQDDEISIYFVGCAAPTGFHGYLARGAAEAGENLGVGVTYIYPDQLTIPNQVQKIEEAIAAQADGIAVCVFTEDAAYADVAARAKEAGIAVGSAAQPRPPASSCAQSRRHLPVPLRTGSDERAAGSADRPAAASPMGVTGRVVVADQQPGDATCQLTAPTLADRRRSRPHGVEAEFLELTMDPGQQAEAISNYLRAHPDTAAATSVCDVIDEAGVPAERSNRRRASGRRCRRRCPRRRCE